MSNAPHLASKQKRVVDKLLALGRNLKRRVRQPPERECREAIEQQQQEKACPEKSNTSHVAQGAALWRDVRCFQTRLAFDTVTRGGIMVNPLGLMR